MSRLGRDEPWICAVCCVGESSMLVIGESCRSNFQGLDFGLGRGTLVCFSLSLVHSHFRVLGDPV